MFTLRTMRPDEIDQVASLIHASTNDWYQSHGLGKIFQGPPSDCRLFCEVYEDLDPGNCLVAEADETGQLLGSCFFHPRETHSSLGIMNSHPDAAGKGVAKAILDRIIEMADEPYQPFAKRMLDRYQAHQPYDAEAVEKELAVDRKEEP